MAVVGRWRGWRWSGGGGGGGGGGSGEGLEREGRGGVVEVVAVVEGGMGVCVIMFVA